ncbi:DDB1- and CUL4-associated factor 4 [Tetranychus urticae]|uniref:DDB1- and CUL4-associated factor 4 n=1 Tax=Tetranychus urticae TaxID=32264 RepID=UPI00077B92A4|nr:DDB1- and CUL4-associated factor 4 [Tetranychus urticae]
MESNMQIDGFYYDPIKKRHFRILNNNKFHPLINTQVKSEVKPSGPMKNFCSELSRLHINRSSFNVQECLLSARFAQMECTKINTLEVNDFRGNPMKNINCDYLIGEPENDSLYGVWSSPEGTGSIIQRLKVSNNSERSDRQFDWRSRSMINSFPSGSKVEDLCMVQITGSPCSAVMCLTNHCKKDLTTYSSLGIYYLSNDTQIENHLQTEDCSLNYEFWEPAYSCCPHTLQTLAIGGNKHIRLFTPLYINTNRTSNDHTLLEVKGKATSLKFSQDGKRLYAGTNNGYLVSFDVTNKKRIETCNLKTKTIAYLHPLKNGNQLIVSCHDSKLLLMDNRNSRSPIITYSDHVNDCKKIPVSVDESVDVLCSSGQDYKIRLWSLKSGKLLHEIPPPENQFSNPMVDDPTMLYSWYSQSWKSLKGEPRPMIFTCMKDKISIYRHKDDS